MENIQDFLLILELKKFNIFSMLGPYQVINTEGGSAYGKASGEKLPLLRSED